MRTEGPSCPDPRMSTCIFELIRLHAIIQAVRAQKRAQVHTYTQKQQENERDQWISALQTIASSSDEAGTHVRLDVKDRVRRCQWKVRSAFTVVTYALQLPTIYAVESFRN